VEVPVQTSHFQLGLVAALAAGLGYSLSSGPAVGYPAGAAVSLGANPVTSGGGAFTVDYGASGSDTLVSAPSDHDLVITDLQLGALTTREACMETWEVIIRVDGASKAHYGVYTGWAQMQPSGTSQSAYSVTNTHQGLNANFSSGIRILAGETATIEMSSFDQFGDCISSSDGRLTWTYSGYLAEP
jgi:hypothetical protein